MIGGLTDNLVITDSESESVDSHVCRGIICQRSVGDLVQNPLQERESLHVPVVVNGDLTGSRDIVMVNLVQVTEICGCSLIGDVYRMVYRKVPDRE